MVVGRPLVGMLLASNEAGASSVVADVAGCSSGMNDSHDEGAPSDAARMNSQSGFFFSEKKRVAKNVSQTLH